MRPEGIPTTSDSELDNEEEELDAFELEQENKMLHRKTNTNLQRISVSAEVYGEYNKKGKFRAPVHAKSND